MSFKFLHCADLHLGCAQYNLRERYEDFFLAFSYIADLAIEHAVSAVLIAGDLFHHRSIDAETLSRAAEIMQRLKDKGILVVSVEGNHDKAYYLERQSWQQYLSLRGLCTLLKPDAEETWKLRPFDGITGSILELESCRMVGFGYLGGSTKQRLEELAPQIDFSDKPTIVLLHAAIDKLMGQDMAGVAREVLEPYLGKVDYFAMGHVHARAQTGDWAYTPGAPECVHIDEAKRGEKGCCIVAIDKLEGVAYKQVDFMSVPRRKILFESVDLTDVALDSVQNTILSVVAPSFANGESKGAILSVSLTGNPDFAVSSVDVRTIEETLADSLNCLHVEVVNEVGMGSQRSESGNAFDRNALEQAVFMDMAKEAGAKDAQRTAALIAALKNGLLTGDAPETMLGYLLGEVEACL